MKLTKQDYQNALIIWSSYCFKTDNELTFPGYIEVKLDEFENPEEKMYKCIQLPPANNIFHKIGSLYSEHYNFLGFPLSDLPKYFELVEPAPAPAPEKITWEEVVTLIESFKRKTFLPQAFYIELIKILDRIKTDHL